MQSTFRCALFCLFASCVGSPSIAGAPPVAQDDGDAQVLTFHSPSLYDVSGTYRFNFAILQLEFTLIQDCKGKIQGSGSASASSIAGDLTIDPLLISGSMKTSKLGTAINLKLSGKGTADIGDGPTPFSFSAKVKGAVESNSQGGADILGTIQLKICIKGQGCVTSKDLKKAFDIDDSFALHAQADGGWSLRIAVSDEGKKLGGTATLVTSPDAPGAKKTTAYIVKGKRSPRTGITTLNLKPVEKGSCGPLKLKVRLLEGTGGEPPVVGEVLEARGRVLGQKFKTQF